LFPASTISLPFSALSTAAMLFLASFISSSRTQ
jgi:hypothetical protein